MAKKKLDSKQLVLIGAIIVIALFALTSFSDVIPTGDEGPSGSQVGITVEQAEEQNNVGEVSVTVLRDTSGGNE